MRSKTVVGHVSDLQAEGMIHSGTRALKRKNLAQIADAIEDQLLWAGEDSKVDVGKLARETRALVTILDRVTR